MHTLQAERRRFTRSLRFRVALGVALPVFMALAALSILLYVRERQILLNQLEETAIRLGEVMRGSLRHAMLSRDDGELARMLTDIGNQQSVLRVAVINAAGQVALTDHPADFTPAPERSKTPGCAECHRPAGALNRHSAVVNLPGQAPVLRSSVLIPNDPECQVCHPAARLRLLNGQTAEAVTQLSQLEEASKGVFADLREAILNLKTTPDAEHTLVQTLGEYVRRFHEMSGVATELRVTPGAENLALAPESEMQLLRIVQEALTNVRKHARAQTAWVHLDPDGGQNACITIGDDGQGFETSTVEQDRQLHFGLYSMRDRAAAAGGSLAVESTPGGGTRVIVRVPLQAEE